MDKKELELRKAEATEFYAEMPNKVAFFLRSSEEKIKIEVRRFNRLAIESAMVIGRELKWCRDQVRKEVCVEKGWKEYDEKRDNTGYWGNWVENRIPWSRGYVNDLIHAYEVLGDNPSLGDFGGILTKKHLILLARQPEDERDILIKKVIDEDLSVKQTKEIIKAEGKAVTETDVLREEVAFKDLMVESLQKEVDYLKSRVDKAIVDNNEEMVESLRREHKREIDVANSKMEELESELNRLREIETVIDNVNLLGETQDRLLTKIASLREDIASVVDAENDLIGEREKNRISKLECISKLQELLSDVSGKLSYIMSLYETLEDESKEEIKKHFVSVYKLLSSSMEVLV